MGSALAERRRQHALNVGADELSDEYLLDQFLNGVESESQEAFGTLVERHGPMVLGICRHVFKPITTPKMRFRQHFLC